MANRITTVVEYAVRDAIKSLQDTQKELGKTEVSGKDLADALRKAADTAELEFDSIRRASSAMEQALGADFVEARRQAGVSVDDIVMELSNLGLSFDAIETDAKDLADAVKRLDDVRQPIKNVGEEARDASGKLDMVRDSGDQSRSVLANLVGNSAQDLGELGGVAGTAGVALGQLAEYATDGNIALGSLAKFAGPLALIGGLTFAISRNMQNAAEARAFREDRVERFAQALRDGADAAKALDEALEVEDNRTIEFIDAATGKTADLTGVLAAAGVTYEEFITQVQGGREAFNDWAASVFAGTEGSNEFNKVLQAGWQIMEDSAEATRKVERETKVFGDSLTDAERAAKDLDAALKVLNDELSAEEAMIGMTEALQQFRSDMESGALSTLEQRQAIVDLKQDMLSYLSALEGVPAETATEIIALIDKGAFDEAERALNNLARERGVPLVAQPGGMGAGIKFRASGGPVSRGDTVVVGEQGPELLHMGSNGYVSPNSVFSGMGAGGQTVINIRTNADPQSTVNAQRRAARRGTRF